MKSIFLIAFILAGSTTLFGQSSGQTNKTIKAKPSTQKDAAKWKEKTHDFGKFMMGPAAEFTFKFKNTGKSPIVVSVAEPGCACTISTFTSTPIGKGKSGIVTASYATKNKPGVFKKTINVVFEDGSTETLTIMGDVVVP
jgi:hypothetical protein